MHRIVFAGSIMVCTGICKVEGILRKACRVVPVKYMNHVRENVVKRPMLNQTGGHM